MSPSQTLNFTGRSALTLLAFASFLASATFLRGLLGPAAVFEGAEKLEYLRQHEGEFSALLIGSSEVFHGLDPRLLDPLVQEAEPEFRSFNLGARAMFSFEQDALLRRAVEAAGPELRWVVLELGLWRAQSRRSFLGTERERDWHDLRETSNVLRVSTGLPLREGMLLTLYHTGEFLRRLSNHGETDRLWRALRGSPRAPYMSPGQVEEARGFQSIDENVFVNSRANDQLLPGNEETYHAIVEGVGTDRPLPFPTKSIVLSREQRRWLESRGIALIYLLPPYAQRRLFGPNSGVRKKFPILIDLQSPEEYPALYDIRNRSDFQHVSDQGAERVTRIVGTKLAKMFENGVLARPSAANGD